MNRKHLPILVAALLGGAVGGVVMTRFSNPDAARAAFTGEHWYAIDQAIHPWHFYIAWVFALAAFNVYWEIAAKSASKAKRSESQGSRAIHVTLVNLGTLIELAPINGLGRFLPVCNWLMASGLAVALGGIFLAVWARVHLGRHWSGEITIKVEHQLIQSGPYRFLRHPIYTGILALNAGLPLITGEWHALIGLALILFAYIRKIRLEEANLETAFGPGYETYRRSTWALVPGLF